jgi:hypothetical protein
MTWPVMNEAFSGGGEYNGVGDLFRPAGAFHRHARD